METYTMSLTKRYDTFTKTSNHMYGNFNSCGVDVDVIVFEWRKYADETITRLHSFKGRHFDQITNSRREIFFFV